MGAGGLVYTSSKHQARRCYALLRTDFSKIFRLNICKTYIYDTSFYYYSPVCIIIRGIPQAILCTRIL
jgi:hypothetical protein